MVKFWRYHTFNVPFQDCTNPTKKPSTHTLFPPCFPVACWSGILSFSICPIFLFSHFILMVTIILRQYLVLIFLHKERHIKKWEMKIRKGRESYSFPTTFLHRERQIKKWERKIRKGRKFRREGIVLISHHCLINTPSFSLHAPYYVLHELLAINYTL